MSNERCFSSAAAVCTINREHSVRSFSFIIRHSVFDILRFSSALTDGGQPNAYGNPLKCYQFGCSGISPGLPHL